MVTVAMPNGDQVEMPDNPSADDLASLKKIAAHQTWLAGESKQDADTLKALPNASTSQKIATQGAIGTEKAWEGFKQMLPNAVSSMAGLNVRSPEEMKAKQAYWDQAAQAGGGGKVMQGVGEALPGMAIPMGGGGLLARTAVGAGTGALQGAMAPVTDPNQREKNAGVGALIGGGLGAAISPIAKGVSNFFSPNRAAGKIAVNTVEPGNSSEAVQDALRANSGTTSIGTTPTASQASGDTGIMSLERASRGRELTAQGWNQADDTANEIRATYLKNLGGNTADAEAAAVAKRDSTTKPLLESALGYIDNQGASGLGIKAQLAVRNINPENMATPEGQQVLANIQKRLSTSNVTANDVHAMRTQLAGVESADPGVGQAKQALDHVLDQSSNGRYGTYLQNFINQSRDVDATRALRDVKATHFQDLPNAEQMPVGAAVGQTPTVSGEALTDALRKQAKQQYGSPLHPADEDAVTALAREEGEASAYKNVAVAAPQVKSRLADTAAAIAPSALAGTAGFVAGGPVPALVAAGLAGFGQGSVRAISRNNQRALAELLRDPNALAAAMELSKQAPAISPNLSQILRGGAVEAGTRSR